MSGEYRLTRRKQKNHTSKNRRRSRLNYKLGGQSNIEANVDIEKFIGRKHTEGPTEVSGVPLVIYRTWHTTKLPYKMKKVVDDSIIYTPEFDNHFFNLEDCEAFIKEHFEPNVVNAYKCLKPLSFKSDLWRFCILYIKGGVYIDIKFCFKRPLIDIVRNNPKIFVTKVKETMPQNQVVCGFLVSPPNNKVFRDCIDQIVLHCKNKDYTDDPLDVTGPRLLRNMLRKYESDEFLDSIPIKFDDPQTYYYNEEPLASEYKGYRKNQRNKSKLPYYGDMWLNKDVFDESIVFE